MLFSSSGNPRQHAHHTRSHVTKLGVHFMCAWHHVRIVGSARGKMVHGDHPCSSRFPRILNERGERVNMALEAKRSPKHAQHALQFHHVAWNQLDSNIDLSLENQFNMSFRETQNPHRLAVLVGFVWRYWALLLLLLLLLVRRKHFVLLLFFCVVNTTL